MVGFQCRPPSYLSIILTDTHRLLILSSLFTLRKIVFNYFIQNMASEVDSGMRTWSSLCPGDDIVGGLSREPILVMSFYELQQSAHKDGFPAEATGVCELQIHVQVLHHHNGLQRKGMSTFLDCVQVRHHKDPSA
jgi:hypothetical protein